MPQRKRYKKQFKEEAIRLVNQEGVSLTQIARDLGINADQREGSLEIVPRIPMTLFDDTNSTPMLMTDAQARNSVSITMGMVFSPLSIRKGTPYM